MVDFLIEQLTQQYEEGSIEKELTRSSQRTEFEAKLKQTISSMLDGLDPPALTEVMPYVSQILCTFITIRFSFTNECDIKMCSSTHVYPSPACFVCPLIALQIAPSQSYTSISRKASGFFFHKPIS